MYLTLRSWVGVCVGLVGCASSTPDVECDCAFDDGALTFLADVAQPEHQGFSAFDGNVHTYEVVVSVPAASDSPVATNPDPVIPSSLAWTVDDKFLSKAEFPEREASVLLTTKNAGQTTITASGKTLSGKVFNGRSR